MNSINHHKIIELAVPVLPEGSRNFWSPLLKEITATCMFPDHYAIQLLNGEDGPWRHYFPAETQKHSFEKLGASARSHFFNLRFFVERITGLLREGDISEACRFLGVFAHHIGDFGETAHYYEYEITLLAPPPPELMNCNSHRMIEDTASTVTAIDCRPAALGDTVDTLIMRLEGRLRELYETSLATIVPMLGALYRKDRSSAAKYSDIVVTATSGVMADILHSFWAIHSGGWTDDEKQSLSSCRLDALEPASYDVEYNYGCRPIRKAITLDQIGHAIPLQVRSANEIRTVDGLCAIPHALPIKGTKYISALEFDLPSRTFSRFKCSAGLLAGYQPQALCRFHVFGNGKILFESPQIGEKDNALEIDVDISGIMRLRLEVATDGSTDKLAMPIWAHPTVCRK